MRPLSPAIPTVTVSVVSHRQWDLVAPLLEQLGRCCRGSVARIVLTVNLPETTEIAPDLGIPVDVVRNAQPQGFGANHNAAFANCRTPWFLVLNPDIRLETDAPAALLARAEPKAGLVAPRIQEPGKQEPEPFRDVLTPMELVRRRLPGHQPPPEPAWVAGMFMLVRSEVFTALDGFDERYFMYCEDFDFCARMRLAGWQLQVANDVVVLHDAQRASNSSLRPFAWHLASFLKLWLSPTVWRYRSLLRRSTASA
jgi:GT2 family glycosyltransferase